MESWECNGENVRNFRSYTLYHEAMLEMDTEWPDCLWEWKLERLGAFLSHQSFLSAFHNL